MKIYTKTGDQGTTSLLGGQRVRKDELQVDACGTLDELNASLGLASALANSQGVEAHGPGTARAKLIRRIQAELFLLGAELASAPEERERLVSAGTLRLLGQAEVADLEKEIDALEAEVPPLRHFLLPGGNAEAAALHLARTIARRAERVIVGLSARQPGSVRPEVLQYVNRLSDLLFVLARAANREADTPEVTWSRESVKKESNNK